MIEFQITDHATVDDQKWVTVIAHKESAAWIRTQPRELWAYTFDKSIINVFDVSDELLLLMKLKWQE